MDGIKIELKDMLFCRERRAYIQSTLLGKYHCPIISFCMNIPGPIKTNPEIRQAFEIGKHELKMWLKSEHIVVAESIEFHENTGDELIMAVHYPARKLKEKSVFIEETPLLGRLFDIDIIDENKVKLCRPTGRKCIICGHPAHECARSRTHSIEELQTKISTILTGTEWHNCFSGKIIRF